MRPPTYSLKMVAVVAIVATGLIHLGTAGEAFGEAHTWAFVAAVGVLSPTLGLPGRPAET